MLQLLRASHAFDEAFASAPAPLVRACVRGDNHVGLELLASLGVDLAAPALDEAHRSPLHVGVARCSVRAVDVLLRHGATCDVADRESNSPIHLLASTAQAPCALLRKLVRHGADVNAENGSGETALHIAARCGAKLTVLELLVQGADVTLRDHFGLSPLQAVHAKGELTKNDADIALALAVCEPHAEQAMQLERGEEELPEWLRMVMQWRHMRVSGTLASHKTAWLLAGARKQAPANVGLRFQLKEISPHGRGTEEVEVGRRLHQPCLVELAINSFAAVRVVPSVTMGKMAVEQLSRYLTADQHVRETRVAAATGPCLLRGLATLEDDLVAVQYAVGYALTPKEARSDFIKRWHAFLHARRPDALTHALKPILAALPWHITGTSAFFALVARVADSRLDGLHLWLHRYLSGESSACSMSPSCLTCVPLYHTTLPQSPSSGPSQHGSGIEQSTLSTSSSA